MRINFFSLIIAILVIFIFGILFFNLSTARVKSIKQKTKQEVETLKTQLNFQKYHYLDGDAELSLTVKEKLKKKGLSKTTLVIRFSELNCNTCIENILQHLNEFIKSFNPNIVLMADYKSEVYLENFKRLNNIKYPVVKIPIGELQIKSEELNMPYLFLLDGNMKINHLYIPMKENPELTEEYLNIMCKRYFKD